MARRALGLHEQAGPPFHYLIIDAPHGRDRQGLHIYRNGSQPAVRHFRSPSVGRCPALFLPHRTILVGKEAGGNADITQESPGCLLLDGRLVGLPPKPPQGQLPAPHVPNVVWPTRNAVFVGIFGVGQLLNSFLGDGLEQAHANCSRGYPRRHLDLGVKRAEGQVLNAVDRSSKIILGPVRIFSSNLLVADHDPPFSRYSENRPVLQLPSVSGLVDRTAP